MVCPHCVTSFFEAAFSSVHDLTSGDGVAWGIAYVMCPQCQGIVIDLIQGRWVENGGFMSDDRWRIWPKGSARSPVRAEVATAAPHIAQDYTEACLVLADSPKASAALSRRCLQNVLREAAGVKPGNLSDEIDQVLGSLPTHLAESIDAVRNIGNFAAHPMKSKQSGEVLDVELGEAEWNLDVLDSLFDFFYVQPAVLHAKKQALNAKLQEAGKPPMK